MVGKGPCSAYALPDGTHTVEDNLYYLLATRYPVRRLLDVQIWAIGSTTPHTPPIQFLTF